LGGHQGDHEDGNHVFCVLPAKEQFKQTEKFNSPFLVSKPVGWPGKEMMPILGLERENGQLLSI
jgi:hypothetical protein